MSKILLALIYLLVGAALAADDAPATVLNLNGAITDPDQIDFEHLPRIEGTHGVICPAEPDWKFQLHNYLLHRDGKYWYIWSHGPGEDQPTQHIRYATSEDGLHWSPSKHLTP